jgi:hypothetical protein
MRRWFIDVALLIGLAVWLVALVGGFRRLLPNFLSDWVFHALLALGPAILLLLVARASPRRLVDFTLMLVFGLWLVAFQVGVRRLVGDLPSWVLGAWYFLGPAALMILVVRGWISQADGDWPLLQHRGEKALLVGFAVWSVVAGFLGTVITRIIVLLLLGPVAFGSMAAGVYQARDHTAAPHRQAIALVLLLLGFAALLLMGQATAQVAYYWAVASMPYAGQRGQVPPLTVWLLTAGGWLVPALLWGLGLRQWTGWSAARSLAWAVAVLGIPVAALAIYRLILLTEPPLSL